MHRTYKIKLLFITLFLTGCAEVLVVEAVGKAAYYGAQALSENKNGKVSKEPTLNANQQTGCIVDNTNYYYVTPAYCKQRNGQVTKNFLVECRYHQSTKREITQEWRCKQNGGYVYTAVRPNVVTGVISTNTASMPINNDASEGSDEIIRCELKQGSVITGYVEVSQQTCIELTGG
jgi:hypothetical protein